MLPFDEHNMRSIGLLDKALKIYQPLGYGYKAIVKLFQEAHEVRVNASVSYSVLPYGRLTKEERGTLYDTLPLVFKTAIPLEQVEKFKAKYDGLAKLADEQKITLKEAITLEEEKARLKREAELLTKEGEVLKATNP